MSDSAVTFTRPPLVEVAIGVQFEPLPGLRAARLGWVWRAFSDRYPILEERPATPPTVELFGLPQVDTGGIKLELTNLPAPARAWFVGSDGSDLIQVQQDRFVLNWRRRADGDVYPRYSSMRSRFVEELDRFRRLVEEGGLGTVEPNQCELTYFNHIVAGTGWHTHDEIDRVFAVWRNPVALNLELGLENASFTLRFALRDERGEPIGRLHVEASPAYRVNDRTPLFVFTLTGRGQPDGQGIDGCLRCLDRAHELAVQAFLSVTTELVQANWRRHDG